MEGVDSFQNQNLPGEDNLLRLICPAVFAVVVGFPGDSAAPQELRLKAAEALGWYTLSFYRQQIYDRLRGYRAEDPDVADEVRRTLRRLEDNAHTK